MNIEQVSIIGAFSGKELEAVVYKNGEMAIYKVERMTVDEVAGFLKGLAKGNTSHITSDEGGTNDK